MDLDAKNFYDLQYNNTKYARLVGVNHPFYSTLTKFIGNKHLGRGKCLEIGCGRGAFQDVVEDYIGVDLSCSVRDHLHKPFIQCDATALPFRNDTFDVIWSYAALEHIPNPEEVLEEMRRVVKNSGYMLLKPAWMCASWTADGYPVRKYRDLNLKGKIIKLSIPIRKSTLFRSAYLIPKRIYRSILLRLDSKPITLKYKRLRPNYQKLWMSDSDAVNSLDPFDVSIWFESRGDISIQNTSRLKRLFIRGVPLFIKVRK